MNLTKYKSVDNNSVNKIKKIINNNQLSLFVGAKGIFSNGGPNIIKLEKKFSNYFNSKYAISVNSWSSGLEIAIAALQLEPGSEVIVSPWTMSANVMSIIKNNLIPVFCDIENKTFNINTKILNKKITSSTKAILVTDIFGHPCNYTELLKICKRKKIFLISDSAQSIGSKYKKKYTGSFSDIGGFSFNSHKHISCGEGGILLTNNQKFFKNMKNLRNHAENFQKNSYSKQLVNMIGSNFRLGEIEAILINDQLPRLDKLLKSRQKIAKLISDSLRNISYLDLPNINKSCTHSFYVYGLVINKKELFNKRKFIVKELKSRGIDFVFEGYANIHMLPLFQNKIAYGYKNKLPWSLSKKKYQYKLGDCPIAEELNNHSFIGIELCKKQLSKKNELNFFIKNIKEVFEKFDH